MRFTRDAGVYDAQSDGPRQSVSAVSRAVDRARRDPAGASAWCCPPGSPPITAARRCAACCSRAATSMRWSASTTRRAIFPIHRSVRFLLLSATAGGATTSIGVPPRRSRSGRFSSGATIRDGRASAWFPVRLTPALLARLSGDDLAVPDLRTPLDLAIAERAAALFRPLGDDRLAAARFGRELNATDDRERSAAGRARPAGRRRKADRAVPRPRSSDARLSISSRRDAARLLGDRHRALAARLSRRGQRDQPAHADRRDAAAGTRVDAHRLLPAHAAAARGATFSLRAVQQPGRELSRAAPVTTHVTTAIVERLPIPAGDGGRRRMSTRSDRSRARSADGDDPHSSARLNARVARLYQLTREEFAHVLSTFPLIRGGSRRRWRRSGS